MKAFEPQKTDILYYSINKVTFNEQFVRESLTEFVNKTQHPHRAIVIADTIKCLSYEIIDRKRPEKARQMCLVAGDTIIGHIKRFCQDTKLEIAVYRWDDLINDPNYKTCYEKITRELAVKPILKQKLIQLSADFLKKRDENRPWKPQDIEVSVDFFVQEVPSFRKVSFKNILIDRVFYTPEKMEIGEVTYQVLSEVGDGLTGIGEPAPHELIRVQCVNQA